MMARGIARRAFGRGVLGVLAVAATLSLSGCGKSEARYRYRMTVEGAVKGSSVYEVEAGHESVILVSEQKPGGSLLRGEALVLETPTGPVFVLLKPARDGDSLISAVTHALAPDIPRGGHEDFWKAVKRLGGWFGRAKAELPQQDWPQMVRFGDMNDPKSVQAVDPVALGVKRIWVETTSEDVTVGIGKRIPWLDKAENFTYSGIAYGDLYPIPSNALRSGLK